MADDRDDVHIIFGKKQPRQLTSSLFIIIASSIFAVFIPLGYNIGVVNAPAEKIRTWINGTLIDRYGIGLEQNDMEILWAFVVSIFLIGAAISSLSGSWIANKFGRKPGIIASALFFLISAILYLCCRIAGSLEMLIIGRLMSGFGAGLSTAIGTMYLAEVAPLSLRGPAATCISLGMTGGIFLAQVLSIDELLGADDLWEYGLSIYGLLIAVSLIPVPWFPESPKYLYLILKDREKTRDVLKKLRGAGSPLIEEEMVALEKEASESESRSILSVIRDPTLLLPLILVILIPFAMICSGLNAVFFYSVSIFEKAGFTSKDAQWATLLIGGINFIIIALSPIIMAKCNRRPLLLLSTFFSIIFLILLGVVIYFIDYAEWLSFISILAMIGFIASLQIGLGPIAFFIGSEIFESGPRPAAMALSSLSFWIGNTFISMIFPTLQLAWGSMTFLFLAGILVVFLLFILPYLPETRGRTTQEVAMLLSNGLKSRPLKK